MAREGVCDHHQLFAWFAQTVFPSLQAFPAFKCWNVTACPPRLGRRVEGSDEDDEDEEDSDEDGSKDFEEEEMEEPGACKSLYRLRIAGCIHAHKWKCSNAYLLKGFCKHCTNLSLMHEGNCLL